MTATLKDWPPNRVLLAAMKGIRRVNITEAGEQIQGVRNGSLFFTGPTLLCIECDTAEDLVPMPTSRGLDGKDIPLFHPLSDAGILVVRGWLCEKLRQHDLHHARMMPEGWES